MKHYYFKSKRETFVAGSTIALQLDFIPTVGRRRGRLIIDRINVISDITLTLAGKTQAVSAEDYIANTFSRLQVFDAEGDRRLLTGFDAATLARLDFGHRVPPPGTTALYNGVDLAASGHMLSVLPIMFTRYWDAIRGEDFSLPVDDLLNGGGINFTFQTVAAMYGSGISAVSAGYVEFEVVCHEAHDMEYHSRDVIRSYDFAAATQFYIPVSGRLLHRLFVYSPAADGGGATTAITDVTIEPYNFANIPYRDFTDDWLMENEAGCAALSTGNINPVQALKCFPVIFPGNWGKIPTSKLIGGQLLVQFGGAATAWTFLVHTITPKSGAMAATAASANGVGAVDSVVKTAGKNSKRDSSDWSEYARFMPGKQV